MADKKKDTQKTATKAVKKTVAKKTEKPVRVMVSEDALPAIKIAQIYNISKFDFFALKKKTGITDDTLLTMSEFRKQYKKAIKEGR